MAVDRIGTGLLSRFGALQILALHCIDYNRLLTSDRTKAKGQALSNLSQQLLLGGIELLHSAKMQRWFVIALPF